MADELLKCPTCLSPVSFSPEVSKDPEVRIAGALGIDIFGNPVPTWTDDPILTARGLSGDLYKGNTRPRSIHIKELRYNREGIEGLLNIIPRTSFSSVGGGIQVSSAHIRELRESTEKILAALGISLADYLRTGTADSHIIYSGDWTDVHRGRPYKDADGKLKTSTFFSEDLGNALSPELPAGTKVRAIHIEELRNIVWPSWSEYWATANSQVIDTGSSAFSQKNERAWHSVQPYITYPAYAVPATEDGESATYGIIPQTAPPNSYSYVTDPTGWHWERQTCTEASAIGFPNGFDIHPCDGGNKYLWYTDYDPDTDLPYHPELENNPGYAYKTGEIIDIDTNVTYPVCDKTWIVNGTCAEMDHTLSYSFLYPAGEGCPNQVITRSYRNKTKSTMTLTVGGSCTGKPNAKMLTMAASVSTQPEASGVLFTSQWTPEMSQSRGSIYTQLNSLEAQSDATREEYLVSTNYNHLIYCSASTSFKFVAESNVGNIPNYYPPGTEFDWRGYPDVAQVIADVYCELRVKMNNATKIIWLRFREPPPDEVVFTYQGKYDGQSFVLSGYYNYSVNVWLGNKAYYDTVINMEDLFYAWNQLSLMFYTSKKIKNDDGIIVTNPAGSSIVFSSVGFYLSATASAIATNGTMFVAPGDGYPVCKLTIVDATAQGSAGDMSFSVGAIRIENDLKTLGES